MLASARADKLADPGGIRLHRLADLDWAGFPRSEAPVWYDQVAATLYAHGISLDQQPPPGEGALIAEVKFAAVRTGRAFALAPPTLGQPALGQPLPAGVTWQPLIGNPIVRRTWAGCSISNHARACSVALARHGRAPV